MREAFVMQEKPKGPKGRYALCDDVTSVKATGKNQCLWVKQCSAVTKNIHVCKTSNSSLATNLNSRHTSGRAGLGVHFRDPLVSDDWGNNMYIIDAVKNIPSTALDQAKRPQSICFALSKIMVRVSDPSAWHCFGMVTQNVVLKNYTKSCSALATLVSCNCLSLLCVSIYW